MTLGCALILVEFNRPGLVLPAALGLLLLLLAMGGLHAAGVQRWAVVLLLMGAVGLVLNAWRRISFPLLLIPTAALMAGLQFLLPGAAPVPIHAGVALVCGGFLGIAGALLTRIAYRARRAKALD